MIKTIAILLLAVALFFMDLNAIGVSYALLVFAVLGIMMQQKYFNEIVLALPLFGYSFCLFLSKLTGVINLGILGGLVLLLFCFRQLGDLNYKERWNVNKWSILLPYSFLLVLILFSFVYTLDGGYQDLKIQLFLTWLGIFLFSINSFDKSLDEFNFEAFLILSFFLFVPHFSNATDKGISLSPYKVWQIYSVLNDGIRGHDFDIITATRISGIGILAYLIYLLDFNLKKAYLIVLLLFFVVMLIVCQTRQSIVALVLPIFLFVVYNFIKQGKRNYLGLSFGLVFIVYAVFNYVNYLNDNGVKSRIVTNVQGTSAEGTGRERIWHAAIEYINTNGEAVGFGNFKAATHAHDYPHNIFLELFIEVGVLSILVFLVILLYVFYELYKVFFVYTENSKLELFLIFATIYFLGLAQFSVDVPRNLMFFYTFALFVFVKYNKEREVIYD
ncbi:O-antigen ligase family protein [Flavobacterium sp. SUN046]|uniref:O-antigen ligase family protein n=1 Tax=Flavobacterium sp. SUN046 TaxID=3002440 RepID=UPI002DBA615E|nr:O-antigen ligase family protein [Flavobacterium sp. SUN046]MEC4049935.1 O-antigen ligase family protein [Flavobacterium sp. SUN046]